jgi:hypothetical protein
MNETIGTPRDTAYIAERYLEGLEYSQRTVQAAWLERYGEDIDIELITGPVLKGFVDIEDMEDIDSEATNQIEEFELEEDELKHMQWISYAKEHRDFRNSMRVRINACTTKDDLYKLISLATIFDMYMAKKSGQSFWDTFSELESAFLNKEDDLAFKPVFVKVGTYILRAETEEQLAVMVAHGGHARV